MVSPAIPDVSEHAVHNGYPLVLSINGEDSIVIASAGNEIAAWSSRPLVQISTLAGIRLVEDPVAQDAALQRALVASNKSRLSVASTLADQVSINDRKLDEIRDYAIEAHEDGTICNDGLNNFLRHFGLESYWPDDYDD